MSAGQEILDSLKDAAAGNFTRVTIEGQTWARIDPAPAGYRTIPTQQHEALMAVKRNAWTLLYAIETEIPTGNAKIDEAYDKLDHSFAALRAAGLEIEG